MVFLNLLGYALGSGVMYWGVVLLLVSPFLLGIALTVLINLLWNQLTGRQEEWRGLLRWFETAGKQIHRLRLEWLGWIPGILIQVWYAGYAADRVQSASHGAKMEYAIAVHATGLLGMVVSAVIFYWIYTHIVEFKVEWWVYVLVGGTALVVYSVLLHHAQTASLFGESWKQIFTAVLNQLIESELRGYL